MKILIISKSAFYKIKTMNLIKYVVNFIHRYILNFNFTPTCYYPIKPYVLSLFLLMCSFSAISQIRPTDYKTVECLPVIHRVHLGVKAGLPGIISAGAEVVSPLLRNRVAPFVEISRIGVDYENARIQHRFLEYGINLYFSDVGRKGYLAVSRSNLVLNGVEEHADAVAESSLSFQGTNVKLGGRWGQRVYFRLEAGFTFGKVPEGIEVNETSIEGVSS